ncbi:MAG TPA: Trm112 family protein [Terracidiphilus sp.]|nr:Trm112 family protein [Terracidiphilus sp.]
MPPEANKTNLYNLRQWGEELACPACYAKLRIEEAAVVCTACARSYPVVDGIPVLIPQRAIEPSTN